MNWKLGNVNNNKAPVTEIVFAWLPVIVRYGKQSHLIWLERYERTQDYSWKLGWYTTKRRKL